ncbi:hypothetical protein Asulf_00550 [Archaeoglobus sulfaticallidus PM70-1]|uniref:Cobalamin biosynthesis protein CbiD n=1 Tax=Archaeoglobus sulfaticallidus PM70-1 TaxID=387631 RepID=N0BJD3_9EURY|nr:cobalt-precorrin-5B (C(1))-methyltransferase [Archaeoglobus sulfaticallidus]AGK60571.1 hypothetical protein Asulf_00550 [Archaeoglobus sulfaticallidus PM70-1]
MRDPIELYRYPEEWYSEGCEEKILSGLYILSRDGFIRRGITTATTACCAMNAAIKSLFDNSDCSVEVLTPAGIKLRLKAKAKDGVGVAEKFSGDHEFDVTNGIEIVARVTEKRGIRFGKGIGEKNGKKAVSRSAMAQIKENFSYYTKKYGFSGGVLIEIPDGEKIAKKTKNAELGIEGGISILGSTGFVEPWCDELVETKIEIAKRYRRISITTGRRAWHYALKKFPEFQPFVFGVHLDRILGEHKGEKIIVGFPGLLSIWAGGYERIVSKARRYSAKVEILEA